VRILIEMAHIAGETLPYWRDTAVVLLALIVIGCLYFSASMWE
jgi:hypothetical protein